MTEKMEIDRSVQEKTVMPNKEKLKKK